MAHPLRSFGLLIAIAASIAPATPARATCNVIPGTVNSFRGALGAADRPYAMPGDFVELTVRSEVCDQASMRLADFSSGGGITAADVIVTLLFEPPNGSPRDAVVIATNCAAIASKVTACDASPTVGHAQCYQATGTDLVVAPGALEDEVRFRFPDTDERVGTPTDDRTLAGPVTIAVTPVNLPLPCGALASGRCADTGGVVACVDELYAIDGTCRTGAAQLDESFAHFVALPPPNDYEAVCDSAGTPCDGTATEVRLTTDAAGNAYLPFDYRGVLVRIEDVPIPRLVRGSTTLDAFAGGALAAIRIPGDSFLASFSPEGHRLPPIFTPLRDPSASGEATLFGSVDAPVGVMRIARRGETFLECAGGGNAGLACNGSADCPSGTCGGATCRGGANDGNACTSDSQCPGGECGPALFEFRDRYDAGIGTIAVPDTDYVVDAESPVPIAGLNETLTMFAFVRSEPIDDEDLNADTDQTDAVLTLRDRETGQPLPIGDSGSAGRAVTEVRDGPFRYPAVEAQESLVAFLEWEPAQGGVDASGNGDVFDSTLRLYHVDSGGVADRTPTAFPTADAAPQVNGGSARFFDATRLLFVTPEAREADQRTELLGPCALTCFPPQMSISANGRYVAFSSSDPNLVPGDTNGAHDVFVLDRTTGQHTRENLGTDCGSSQSSGGAVTPSLSADGSRVAFRSGANDLVTGSSGMHGDIFVRDRLLGCTWRVPGGVEPNQNSFNPRISADGRYVSFDSRATNLVPGDTDASLDVYVGEVGSSFIELVTVPSMMTNSAFHALSGNGRFVFFSDSEPHIPEDDNQTYDIYARDLWLGETTRVFEAASVVSMSADGRLIAFTSAGPFVPGDTNGLEDVFVLDRVSGHITRVSVSSAGGQANGLSSGCALSPNGRFVVFRSEASNLVPGDTNANDDIFVHDRVTSATRRASVGSSGAQGSFSGDSTEFAISDDGVVVFVSSANNLVPGDVDADPDIFLRDPDPSDLAADRSGDAIADDDVLRVVDASGPGPATVADLCPAEQVAHGDGLAAFLRPESAGESTNAGCTGASLSGPDLNGDSDANDRVVHLWNGTTVSNLRCAAQSVALSATRIAALISEADQYGLDVNGDGDMEDGILHVRSATAPAGSVCDWIDTGLFGTEIGVSGDRVVVLVSELEQGEDRNGDGDFADTVLQLVDGITGVEEAFNNPQGGPLLPPAAEEFVLGPTVAAFRTSERAQSSIAPPGCSVSADLNGDGDCNDAVLQTLDLATGVIISTGQAAVPCGFETCDPRIPYRVMENGVRFLTAEAQQGGEDLDGDGVATGVVLQTFNAARAAVFGPTGSSTPQGGTEAGYCNDTGLACSGDADCGSGADCFVPPGQCILDLGTACDPQATTNSCGANRFCKPTSPTTSTCHEVQGSCKWTGDCTNPAICEEADQQPTDIPEPLAVEAGDAGEQVFASSGICFENRATVCASDDDCPTGEECRAGTCHRNHGACASDADCPAGTCTRDQLITASAADADADGVADPLDNCPATANADQADADTDGTGDACDLWICGNGVREGTPGDPGIEECDDGDQDPGDGCDAICQLEAPDCNDGFDNDGDGKADFGVSPANDPGCGSTLAPRENPQCDDGVDNDFDGLVDHPADDKCKNRKDDDERTNPPCGLGVELVALVTLLRRVARRSSSGDLR